MQLSRPGKWTYREGAHIFHVDRDSNVLATLRSGGGRLTKVISDELAKRAAMWAATLRDDAASLREHARRTRDPKMRVDLVSLANALNRAAKVLDTPAGHARTKRPAPARRKKSAKRKTADRRRKKKRSAHPAI